MNYETGSLTGMIMTFCFAQYYTCGSSSCKGEGNGRVVVLGIKLMRLKLNSFEISIEKITLHTDAMVQQLHCT